MLATFIINGSDERAPSLTKTEGKWLASVAYKLHDHTACEPATPLWWIRLNDEQITRGMN